MDKPRPMDNRLITQQAENYVNLVLQSLYDSMITETSYGKRGFLIRSTVIREQQNDIEIMECLRDAIRAKQQRENQEPCDQCEHYEMDFNYCPYCSRKL